MTEIRYDETILSDLHKDAYGFRPRAYFWDRWNGLSVDARIDLWDSMIDDLDCELDRARRMGAAAIAGFEASITSLLSSGAPDRQTAIRWLVDASGDFEPENPDPGYLCWCMGLPPSMEREFAFLFQNGG